MSLYESIVRMTKATYSEEYTLPCFSGGSFMLTPRVQRKLVPIQKKVLQIKSVATATEAVAKKEKETAASSEKTAPKKLSAVDILFKKQSPINSPSKNEPSSKTKVINALDVLMKKPKMKDAEVEKEEDEKEKQKILNGYDSDKSAEDDDDDDDDDSGSETVNPAAQFIKTRSVDMDKKKGIREADTDSEVDAALGEEEKKNPNAYLHDAMYDHSGDHEELDGKKLRKANRAIEEKEEAERKRKAEEENKPYVPKKEMERAHLQRLEMLDEEDDADDDDDDDDDDSFIRNAKRVRREANQNVKSESAPTGTIKVKSKSMAAKKMLERSSKKTKTKTSAVAAGDKEALESIQPLMPQLIYQRCLPPSIVRELDKTIKDVVTNPDQCDVAPGDYDKTREYVQLKLASMMLIIESLCNAKDHENTAKSEPDAYKTFDGNYSAENVARHQRHTSFWVTEQERGTRGTLSAEKGEDEPLGVRPIDYAYTKWKLETAEERVLPENYQKFLFHALLIQALRYDSYKVVYRLFIMTQKEIDRVKQAGVEAWRCIFTQEEFENGDIVACIAAAPSPVLDINYRSAVMQRGIKSGMLRDFGITSMKKFINSDLNSPEMANAPFVGFIKWSVLENDDAKIETIDEIRAKKANVTVKDVTHEKEEEEEEKTFPNGEIEKNGFVKHEEEPTKKKEEPTKKKEEPTKEEESTKKKEEELTKEEDEEMSAVAENPLKRKAEEDDDASEETKKTKKARLPAIGGGGRAPFKIEPNFPPEPINYLQASTQDPLISYQLNGKSRGFVATADSNAILISPNTRVFFTDNNVKVLKDTTNWLFQNAQLCKQDQARGRIAHRALCAQRMLAILTSSWPYTADNSNTGEMIAKKLNLMKKATQTDETTGAETSLFDEITFYEWIMFLLCSFESPVEYVLLTNNQVTGRGATDGAEDKETVEKIDNNDSDHMAIGEIPFGRQLTTRAFLLQFVRIVFEAIEENIIKPFSANGEKEFTLSGKILFDAIVNYAEHEGEALKVLANEANEEDFAEKCKAHISRQVQYWKGPQSQMKKDERVPITKMHLKLRHYLNQWKMDEETLQLLPTRAFIGTFFPLQF